MLTIVVIDEDSAIRSLLQEWLDMAGYRVRSRPMAGGAPEAGVDLVLVDLVDLPGQGLATVRQARERHPGAVVIGLSTQLTRSLPASSVQAGVLGVAGLVSKPCERQELLRAVADAIGLPH